MALRSRSDPHLSWQSMDPVPSPGTLGTPRLPSAPLSFPRLPSAPPSRPSASPGFPRLPSAPPGAPRLPPAPSAAHAPNPPPSAGVASLDPARALLHQPSVRTAVEEDASSVSVQNQRAQESEVVTEPVRILSTSLRVGSESPEARAAG